MSERHATYDIDSHHICNRTCSVSYLRNTDSSAEAQRNHDSDTRQPDIDKVESEPPNRNVETKLQKRKCDDIDCDYCPDSSASFNRESNENEQHNDEDIEEFELLPNLDEDEVCSYPHLDCERYSCKKCDSRCSTEELCDSCTKPLQPDLLVEDVASFDLNADRDNE